MFGQSARYAESVKVRSCGPDALVCGGCGPDVAGMVAVFLWEVQTVTSLTRMVQRRTVRPSRLALNRAFVVALEPGDVVAVRVLRERRTFRITVEQLYEHLVTRDLTGGMEERELRRRRWYRRSRRAV